MIEVNFASLPLLIFSFSLISLLTFFLHHLSHRRHAAVTGTPKTPCPQSYPVIGNLIGFLRNRHRFHDWVTEMLAATPTLTLQVNGFLSLSHGVCTADSTNLHHLLRSNFPNYIKGHRYTSVLHELLGDGIFNADGHLWSSQRKIASYEFNTKSLKTFISDTVQSQLSKSLIPHLASAVDAGEILDLQEILRKFSFDNICNVAFGVDPGSLRSNGEDTKNSLFIRAFDYALEHSSDRFMSPVPAIWKIERFLNIRSERKYRESIEVINEFAINIIKSKEMGNVKKDEDLLSRFMVSSSEIGIDDEEERRKFLRDIVISFILAGKDSTSTALTWFFWLMAGHPQCERLIEKELSAVMAMSPENNTGNFSYDDSKKFNYLHAAISESMRLFPPIAINSRLTVDEDTLPDGTYVGKGWFADYSAYAMGRMERLWGPDCRDYKPERWLDDNGLYQPLDPFKYPVFHGGPRMCLGKEMAYLQMKYLAAAIIYEFEIEAIDGGGTRERMMDPPYTLSIVLKMKNGLRVRLKRKKDPYMIS